MYSIRYLIWSEYTKFDAKVWTINEEIEFWRSIDIPAGQCSGTPSRRNSCFTFSRDTRFHTTMVMVTEQPWSESGGLSSVERTGAASVSHMHSWYQSPRLVEEWQTFEQKIIDWAISQWRLRRRSCIQQEGGHFEHRLWNSIDKTVCHWPLITCNVNFKFSAMHFRC